MDPVAMPVCSLLRSSSASRMDGRHESPSCLSRFWSSATRTKALPHPPDSSANGSPSKGALLRRLSLFDLLLLGIGASIGAGVFVVTGTVAREAGPGVTISFGLAGASCVLNGLCYAELASRFPAVSGGAYLYTYTAFNELTAFLVFAQLMLDYHIGAASIARSLANYLVTLLELFFFKDNIPSWIGHGGQKFLGGNMSINLLAPIILLVLTVILCLGVKESSAVNSIMTATKVIIVLFVICAGSFEVDTSNWTSFAPNGAKAILTGATVVFFAYVGFDAVANCAEESKKPQRDLPLGIMGSLLVCVVLYIGVCLVITGIIPYQLLSEEAPLAAAFTSKGMKYVAILISIGAVAGLTTTLLVGLYVQSRLYLAIGRHGLLPKVFSKVHPARRTPIRAQVWVGVVAGILAGLFNVRVLSHILSVGSLTGYSVVSACVVVLRWDGMAANSNSSRWISSWREGVLTLFMVACGGFVAGLCYRLNTPLVFPITAIVVALLAIVALQYRQVYARPASFSCPWVPILPALSIFFNIFLFSQLHYEAWVRFIILSIITVGVYAFYGQYHADPHADETIVSHQAPPEVQ